MYDGTVIEYLPDYSVTPGEVLSYELDVRGFTVSELTRRLGVPFDSVQGIIENTKSITPELALSFEQHLGMTKEYWLNLETNYLRDLARNKSKQLNSQA